MAQITLTLGRKDFPIILRTYGLEGAKRVAIAMCLKQNMEITETNLYSVLNNLESDLQMETAMYTEVE